MEEVELEEATVNWLRNEVILVVDLVLLASAVLSPLQSTFVSFQLMLLRMLMWMRMSMSMSMSPCLGSWDTASN